jgi:hypothetical protein
MAVAVNDQTIAVSDPMQDRVDVVGKQFQEIGFDEERDKVALRMEPMIEFVDDDFGDRRRRRRPKKRTNGIEKYKMIIFI